MVWKKCGICSNKINIKKEDSNGIILCGKCYKEQKVKYIKDMPKPGIGTNAIIAILFGVAITLIAFIVLIKLLGY